MMNTTAKISGVDELISKLDRIIASVDGRKQGETLEKAAGPILERMQQLVPVRTGGLKDSLVILLGDDGLTVSIGPAGGSAWRAHFVELGTVNMPAQPFIRPAFDSEKGNVTAKVAGQLRSDILDAAEV